MDDDMVPELRCGSGLFNSLRSPHVVLHLETRRLSQWRQYVRLEPVRESPEDEVDPRLEGGGGRTSLSSSRQSVCKSELRLVAAFSHLGNPSFSSFCPPRLSSSYHSPQLVIM